jgi:hypothetical protein
MLHVLSTREWHHGGSPSRAGGAAHVAAADAFGGNASWEELLEGWEDALQGGAGAAMGLGRPRLTDLDRLGAASICHPLRVACRSSGPLRHGSTPTLPRPLPCALLSACLRPPGGSSSVVVLGALQDSYQQFQYQLSCNLARDHPELSEQLCEEMMTRQLECADKVRRAGLRVRVCTCSC